MNIYEMNTDQMEAVGDTYKNCIPPQIHNIYCIYFLDLTPHFY